MVGGVAPPPPPAGATTATDSAIRLPLEQVQLVLAEPAATLSLVEPAPLEFDCELDQREVWPVPAVKVAAEAPVPTASISAEPAGATVTGAESVLAESAMAGPAVGALWAAPLTEIDPASTPLTAPANVIDTVWAPAA